MPRKLSAFLLFLLASAAGAYANVSVLVIAIGNPDDPALSKVIGTAAVVRLQRADLVATNESGAAGTSSVPGATTRSNAPAADFVLVISYTHTGGQVALELSFRETRTGKTIATSAKTVPFDLNLDVNVSNAVDALLTEPSVEKAIKTARERTPPPKKAATVTPKPPPNRATPPPAGTVQAQPAAPRPHVGWRYAFGLHGAPMLLVGNASNYFRYGVDVSLYNGVRLPVQKLLVEIGLLTGASQLFSVFGTTAGTVYTVGVGPQIKIGSDPLSATNIALVASGGATFILARPTGTAFEAKTDLYAAGGISASLKLFRSVVVGMELSTRVVFEERYPIVAVIPAVTVGF